MKRLCLVWILAWMVLLPGMLYADGGALVMRVRDGNMIIAVFTSPVPLRVGRGDISVLMQRVSDQTPVLDGEVTVRLSMAHRLDVAVPATHEKATNKLLYASAVALPVAGDWVVQVNCKAGQDVGRAVATLEVLPPAPPLATYWLYFALVPAGLAVFVLNQWLKAHRNRRRDFA